ncbi:DMT family transporter [uncultured Limimaricola sp.]|uniref:DMT family transporter n=1 Tax=uncultured Limimaricola sp. TaxID=2211667 RepID=UPI0030F6DE56
MEAVRPREDRTGFGLVLMAGAVGFFTCVDTSAKWLILAGFPALQVVFARYAGHLLLSLALYMPNGGLARFRSAHPLLQFLRSGFLLGSTFLNFTALNYLPLTITTTVMFAGPIAVTLLSIPILGERVGIRRLAAVLVGFSGVLVVVQPWGAAFHPAMILSLGALCCASLYFVLTRMIAGAESTATSQLWSSGLSSLVIAPMVLPVWQWPSTLLEGVILVAIGLFGGVGHIFATVAHRFADASLLAPVVYIQIVFASLASILVFATWPTGWTLLGGAIIVAAGAYIWNRERR